MKIGRKTFFFIIVCIGAAIIYSFLKNTDAIGGDGSNSEQALVQPSATDQIQTDKPSATPVPTPTDDDAEKSTETPVTSETPKPSATPKPSDKPKETKKPDSSGATGDIAVVAEPESVAVLVNKQNKLPDDYNPNDLVYPDVRFLFDEKIEKRMMRKEAAEALEKMFEAAIEDGIHLAGVSAYRSHKTQTALFERYVKKDGMEKALTYSAYPGTSEHETGLAIDVSGSSGKCAVDDCFADTKESDWLKENVFEYGFIIRYPEGKESITGYQYEPWHLRYVGTEVSLAIGKSGESLEEYYNVNPVSK